MKYSLLLILALMIITGVPVSAQAPIPAEAVSPEHFAQRSRHHPFPRTGKIVSQYIKEKTATGEIDPTEFEQLKSQRQALRAEIKTLREAGDEDGVKEKMQELRQQRQQQREYVRGVINDNPELQQRITEKRLQARRWQLKRRQDMLDRRSERLRDRRQHDRTH